MLLFSKAFSSQGIGREDYTGIIHSTNYKSFAVAAVIPVANEYSYPKSLIFLVYNSKSREILWEGANVYGPTRDISISDDGEFVVVFRKIIYDYYLNIDHKKEVNEKFGETVVLQFFRRNELIKEYTIKDLGVKIENNNIARNAVYIARADRIKLPFGVIVENEKIHSNPMIIDNYVLIRLLNGKKIFFNIKSGEMLDSVPDEFQDHLKLIEDWDDFFRN